MSSEKKLAVNDVQAGSRPGRTTIGLTAGHGYREDCEPKTGPDRGPESPLLTDGYHAPARTATTLPRDIHAGSAIGRLRPSFRATFEVDGNPELSRRHGAGPRDSMVSKQVRPRFSPSPAETNDHGTHAGQTASGRAG